MSVRKPVRIFVARGDTPLNPLSSADCILSISKNLCLLTDTTAPSALAGAILTDTPCDPDSVHGSLRLIATPKRLGIRRARYPQVPSLLCSLPESESWLDAFARCRYSWLAQRLWYVLADPNLRVPFYCPLSIVAHIEVLPVATPAPHHTPSPTRSLSQPGSQRNVFWCINFHEFNTVSKLANKPVEHEPTSELR